MTKQRQVIFDVLRNAQRPLSRDEIVKLGREQIQRLGSATVDRAIREMVKSFELIGVDFPGQPMRYELPAECEHPHFICRECELVYDLPFRMHLPNIKAPEGFDIQGGEVIYSGTCPACRHVSGA